MIYTAVGGSQFCHKQCAACMGSFGPSSRPFCPTSELFLCGLCFKAYRLIRQSAEFSIRPLAPLLVSEFNPHDFETQGGGRTTPVTVVALQGSEFSPGSDTASCRPQPMDASSFSHSSLQPQVVELHPFLFPGGEAASPWPASCRHCGKAQSLLQTGGEITQRFAEAVRGCLAGLHARSPTCAAAEAQDDQGHVSLLQEVSSDIRFLCERCVRCKYDRTRTAATKSPITGPLFFPTAFDDEETTAVLPSSVSPAPACLAAHGPGACARRRSSATRVPKSRKTRRRVQRQRKSATALWFTSVAQTLRTARAEDPLTQRQAIELAEWVEQQQIPEEGLESQVAWLVMEHCSGTPGVLDLPTLGAFLAIAAETHQPELPAPLDLIVANVTKWRPDILKWFQHTAGDVFLVQETHLTLDQENQAKAQLQAAGLHSFWCGASPTNLTKGGIAIATKWQNHMRFVHQFTIDGCGILAVELPRVKWRLVVIAVYLQTGIGLHSEPNVSILAELLSLVKCFPNWVAAGDFNVDVDKFASTNIAEEARAEIIASKEAAIHTGNTLDFALASRSVAPLLQLTVDKVVPFAPHFALRFHLDLKHGHVRLPQLRGFGGNVRQSHKPREQDPSGQTETAPGALATAKSWQR